MRRLAILGAMVYAGFIFNAAQGIWDLGFRVVTRRGLQNIQVKLLLFTLTLGLMWPDAGYEEDPEPASLQERF